MFVAHDAFGLCFAFESGGAFSVVQFTQVAKGKHIYIYIYIYVNKLAVAYQDVDFEHGVLASVMRAKWRCSIHSHDTKRSHIDVAEGFGLSGCRC